MEKTKRLLLVVTQAEWGGVQGFVFRCAMEARRRGIEVLVAAGSEGLLENRCTEARIPYRRLQRLRRDISPVHDINATRELLALLRDWKPDTIFLHSSKAGIVGSIAARLLRVSPGNLRPRVVYRIGGWSFLDPVSPLQKTLRLWSEKLTAPLKDLIITVHPGDEERARQHRIHANESAMTIANGLDISGFDAQQQPRHVARNVLAGFFPSPLPPDAHVLLSIAHFYPTKDLTGYLRALAIVIKEHPSVRAILLGDGEQRAELEALRQTLGLDAAVALPGAHATAATLLSGADLFVLSSAKEGMPWTVLEAMAARTPIVTTDVGSNRWALGDDAWIVPPKNPELLAEAIRDALQNTDRARTRAAQARAAIETRFTEQEMWTKTFGALGLQ